MHINYRYVVHFAELQRDGASTYTVLDYGCGAGDVVVAGRERGMNFFGSEVFYAGGNTREIVEHRGVLGTLVREIQNGCLDFPDAYFDLIINNAGTVGSRVPCMDRHLLFLSEQKDHSGSVSASLQRDVDRRRLHSVPAWRFKVATAGPVDAMAGFQACWKGTFPKTGRIGHPQHETTRCVLIIAAWHRAEPVVTPAPVKSARSHNRAAWWWQDLGCISAYLMGQARAEDERGFVQQLYEQAVEEGPDFINYRAKSAFEVAGGSGGLGVIDALARRPRPRMRSRSSTH